MNTLTLPLRGECFDAIKAGDKTEEYRLCTEFWEKRIEEKWIDRIVLTRGYPKRTDGSRRMVLPWRGYEIKEITHPHFTQSGAAHHTDRFTTFDAALSGNDLTNATDCTTTEEV